MKNDTLFSSTKRSNINKCKRLWIFVFCYISSNVTSKYSQKLLDHGKQSAT